MATPSSAPSSPWSRPRRRRRHSRSLRDRARHLGAQRLGAALASARVMRSSVPVKTTVLPATGRARPRRRRPRGPRPRRRDPSSTARLCASSKNSSIASATAWPTPSIASSSAAPRRRPRPRLPIAARQPSSRAVVARQQLGGGLADEADAERIDEAVERQLRRASIAAMQLLDLLRAPARSSSSLASALGSRAGGRCRRARGSAPPRAAAAPACGRAPRCRTRRGDEVAQPLGDLGRADQPAGAAPHRLALGPHREAAAERAVLGKLVGLGRRRASLEHDLDDLRDHVAGALQHHRVADRGCPCARSSPRCAASRGATTTPPTVTGSSMATGVSAPVRPTWIAMSRSHVSACSAGNLCAIAQRGARPTKPSRRCRSSRRPCRRRRRSRRAARAACVADLARDSRAALAASLAAAGQRIDRESPSPSAGRGTRCSCLDRRLGLAPAIGEEAQPASRGDAASSWRSEPAAALRGFMKSGLPASARAALSAAKSGAPYRPRRAPRAAAAPRPQALRDVADGADIVGDLLADRAVAAGGAAHQQPVLVAQRARQAVDLRLRTMSSGVVGGEPEEAPDARAGIRARRHRPSRCRATASAPRGAPWRSIRPAARRPAGSGCRARISSGKRASIAGCADAGRRIRRR